MFDPLSESYCKGGKCILDDIVLINEDSLFVNSEMQQNEEVAISVENGPYGVLLLESPIGTTEYQFFVIGCLRLLPDDGVANEIYGIEVPATEPPLAVENP